MRVIRRPGVQVKVKHHACAMRFGQLLYTSRAPTQQTVAIKKPLAFSLEEVQLRTFLTMTTGRLDR